MSKVDIEYFKLLEEILGFGEEHATRAHYADGTRARAKKLRRRVMLEFDLEEEFPILTSKRVGVKDPSRELSWIYVLQSNVVQDLRDLGCSVWDEWEIKEGPWKGTIGPAYGEQVRKHRQMEKLIDGLVNNPYDRGHLINLWDNGDLPQMALRPCVFLNMWDVTDGRLNCTIIQR